MYICNEKPDHLHVKKVKLYLLFILNKTLSTIIILKLLLFIFNKENIPRC